MNLSQSLHLKFLCLYEKGDNLSKYLPFAVLLHGKVRGFVKHMVRVGNNEGHTSRDKRRGAWGCVKFEMGVCRTGRGCCDSTHSTPKLHIVATEYKLKLKITS